MSHCTNFHRRCGGVSSVAMLARMCGFSCCHAVATPRGGGGRDVWQMCIALDCRRQSNTRIASFKLNIVTNKRIISIVSLWLWQRNSYYCNCGAITHTQQQRMHILRDMYAGSPDAFCEGRMCESLSVRVAALNNFTLFRHEGAIYRWKLIA